MALFYNAIPQSFTSNTVETCELNAYFHGEIGDAMRGISHDYNIRICSEDSTLRKSKSMTFTNSTLEHVFGTVMNNATNHIWRYETETETIYVQPETNAVSMIRCGPIAVTNVALQTLVNEIDVLGFKNNHGKKALLIEYRGFNSWMNELITLESEEVYVWEMLDLICSKLSQKRYWQIQKEHPLYDENLYYIFMVPTNASFPPWDLKNNK